MNEEPSDQAGLLDPDVPQDQNVERVGKEDGNVQERGGVLSRVRALVRRKKTAPSVNELYRQ